MKEMLIFVDTKDNKNKFYKLELVGDIVHIEYGRVGATPRKTKAYGGQREFNRKMNEKLRKGYIKSSVDLALEDDEKSEIKSNILEIAMQQIKTDSDSKKLIKKLVDQNIHNITSQTKINYNSDTGYFKTPLGVITKNGVNQAFELLAKIEKIVLKGNAEKSKMFVKYNERYFAIIPTKIQNLRVFENLLNSAEKISNQFDICMSLIDSIDIIEAEKKKQKQAQETQKTKKEPLEKVFEATVLKLEDKTEFERIKIFFEQNKNSKHGNYANSYHIDNIYKISLGQEEENFRKDLNHQMELFHGTKVSNLLSILKSGLLMPKYSPGAVSGYMFGKGLYFSDQTTKSLNYCDGMYWSGTKKQDKIYMFIADIAMGNYFVPDGACSTKPPKGYNSYWAKPNKSGILNNEMIIFENNQIRLKYLLEIKR
jgi:poly [ADP-ribose] polymerase